MPCDYSKYPKDWKAIRAEVLERAKHACEGCGVANYAVLFNGRRTAGNGPHEAAGSGARWPSFSRWTYSEALEFAQCMREAGDSGERWSVVVLTISHTDHDVTNNGSPGDRPNLRALCQRCHLAHDADTHRANARATRYRKSGLKSLFEP